MQPAPEFRKQTRQSAVRILLLEDEPSFAALVRSYLGRASWGQPEVETVETLEAALACLSTADYDLVIADLNLPDSAGLATLERLGQATEQLIIVLTGQDDAATREAAMRYGAYDFLQKSEMRPADLERVVRLAVMQGNSFRSLRDSEARYRTLTELSSDWYWEQDAELRFVVTGGRNEARGGITAESHIGKRRWELARTEILGQTWEQHKSLLAARDSFHDLLLRRTDASGGVRYVSVAGVPIFDRDARFAGYRGVAKDVTERVAAELALAAHARYQERIASLGQSALAKRDPDSLAGEAVHNILEALKADAVCYFEPGPSDGELIVGARVGRLKSDAEAVAAAASLLPEVLRTGETVVSDDARLPFEWAGAGASMVIAAVRGEGRVRGALFALLARSHGFGPQEQNFIGASASVLSSGLQRIDSEGRLAFLAQFDALTGLPNRALLRDRFAQMIGQARRHGSPLAALFIDLDQFKVINDTLGHAAGDELLQEAARRLESAVRPGDTVARISGDEFAVVLGDLAHPDDAALVAQKILEKLAAPLELYGQQVFVRSSIGIAAFPTDGDDAETLLSAADAAMYRAKQSGGNSYQFFTTEITQRTRARAQLGAELRRALERGELALAYQPKVELLSGRPNGAEALLRWRHPERGTVSPAEFVPVLEETGLIVPVGEWVVRRACEDIKAWAAAGLRPLPVAVNLSARQFRQPDLDRRICALVREVGVAPSLIEMEITESQLMQDPDHAIRVMRALKDAGIRIAIDDFGTGYSSLAYLTRLPVSALKIDRSFVAGIERENGDAAIVRTIIEMAHTLGFTVVAEGVETEVQAAYLRQFGCELAQGYLFWRPMPADDFRALLKAIRAPA